MKLAIASTNTDQSPQMYSNLMELITGNIVSKNSFVGSIFVQNSTVHNLLMIILRQNIENKKLIP